MENKKIWIWVVIGLVALAGIAYVLWPQPADLAAGPQSPEITDTSKPALVETATEAIVEEVATEETDDDLVVAEATETVAIPPTPKQELESTNPDTVNLASGDIQLVEVFAFW